MTAYQQIIAFISLLAFAGCGGKPEYNVVWRNATQEDINQVATQIGTYDVLPANLGPGISREHLFVNEPLPESLTLSWEDNDGNPHSTIFTIDDDFRAALRTNTLVFEVRPSEAVMLIEDEETRNTTN